MDSGWRVTVSVEAAHEVANGEVALWRAVINQALQDARNKAGPRVNSFNNVFDQASARRWLGGRSGDFELVCIWAGIEPSVMKERAREVMRELVCE